MDVQLKPQDFKYVILPVRFCDENRLALLKQIYEFWHSGWIKVFKDNGLSKTPDARDFFRQDFVTAVTHQSTIAAIHFYSLYDFRSELISKHNYIIDHFNEQFLAECRKRGFLKLMSMESLLANPDYRKSKTGLNFSDLMGSLGQKIFLEYTDADCIFTPTRADNKTTEAGARLGFQPLQQGLMVHNTPVDLLVCDRKSVKNALDPVRFFVEHLWNKREVSRHLSQYRTAA